MEYVVIVLLVVASLLGGMAMGAWLRSKRKK